MKHIAIIVAAGCIALAGCSKEEQVAPQSGDPIRLLAAVNDRPDGFTRVTTENSWNGGEEIAVEVRGEVKKYVVDANGTLTPAPSVTPFYWQKRQEQIRAWRLSTFLSAEPDQITVQADQSGAGYGASDFLFAAGTVTPSNPSLAFAHKTVKVVLNVRADGRAVQSLKIGDGNLAMTGVWNKTAESIDPAQGGRGTVTAFAEKTADGFDASYSALLIPQEMGGKSFIHVTVNDQENSPEYSYTPKEGEAVLEGGKCYTYNVTVRNGITVEPVGAGDWNDGGAEDVGVRTDFTADVLKAGDYLYADGSWSDGGLRTRLADGQLVWAETKPSPTAGKKVIGIVFQTDPSRISAAEKAMFAADGKTLHGLAMSVKSAGNNSIYGWYCDDSLTGEDRYTRDESAEDPLYSGYYLPHIYDTDYATCFTLADADINGYFNTEVIKVRRAADLAAGLYRAFKATADFAAEAGGPAKGVFTSGWYLPSSGQWIDFMRNVAGLNLQAGNLLEVDWSEGDFYWKNNGDVPALLNAAMSTIPDEDKITFKPSGESFWTSSAASPLWARLIRINGSGSVYSHWNEKHYEIPIRCVLAF